MEVDSTSDVPIQALQEFADELGPEFGVKVNTGQVFLRSVEPPSWVTLLAQADWWIKILAGYAALYVAELVKEAAKETWRQRGKVVAAAGAAGGQLRRLAEAIAALRRRLPAKKTVIGVGVPVPDAVFPTRLALEGEEPDGLLRQLALFVHHLPALTEFIAAHGLAEGRAIAGMCLTLQDDGSLLISWNDRDTLEREEHVLPLRDAV